MNHTYAAWAACPSGSYGVWFDHSPDRQPAGCYTTEGEAWAQVQAVQQAQPGAIGWVIRKP